MSSRSVTVLTVHGRRLNVKVEPDMTILEILETVCRKYNFSPEKFDLKHHNRVLDLSTMFRFSGLPNNAMLEMAEVKRLRAEDNVTILLQLENGQRPSGTFKPSDSLMHVFEVLCPEQTPGDTSCLMVYMRREVYWDAMATTSLKSLGLCNGRAILRLLHRMPEVINTQANVSAPLPSSKRDNLPTVNADSTENCVQSVEINQPSNNQSEAISDEVQSPAPQNATQIMIPEPEQYLSPVESPSGDAAKKSKTDTAPMETGPSHETVPDAEPLDASAQIVFIGDRQAMLYHASTSERELIEPNETFFELTVPEVLQMQKHLQERVKALEEAPLVTSTIREHERNQNLLSSMSRYRQAVLRVQFPDRYILQGDFQVHETVSHIEEFVRSFLAVPTMPFYLYTTPPKAILDSKSSLFEAGCFPLALLHFGSHSNPPIASKEASGTSPSEPVCVLRSELLSQLSNATGAAVVLARARRGAAKKAAKTQDEQQKGDDSVGDNICDESSAAGPSNRIPNRNFRQSSTTAQATNDREAKILKFLKK